MMRTSTFSIIYVALLVTPYPLQPDLIITTPPLNLDDCPSSSCWIGVADGTTLFLNAPLVVPYDAHLRLSPWPIFGRASLVAVNGTQLGVVEGALSIEALDLFGTIVRADNIINGGCIFAGRGARLNITYSSLNNCTSFGSGGALFVGEKAYAHLRQIRAVHGAAFEEGGLIYAAHNASVIIDGDSVLSLAYATSGGLISTGAFATLDISGTTALKNGTATYVGGIIKAGFGARVTLRNDTRLEYGAAQKEGGCVYAEPDGIIYMQDNTMLQLCSANSEGGGIYSGGNVWLSGNAVVFGCNAQLGGGILIFGAGAVVEIRETAEVVRCAAYAGGGVAGLLETRILLRDSARITACTAIQEGGGVYGYGSIITLVGDAVISNCYVLSLSSSLGGGIFGDTGTFVELHDAAQVVECQAQGAGGGIFASDILIADSAHVGYCTALNSLGTGSGGCLVGLSRIVISDFAALTHCDADYGGAFFFADTGTIILSGNAMVSDCTAVWSGAVGLPYFNTTVILQDDAIITRAYSGLYGTFALVSGSSLLMTGRSSIHECVAEYGSAVFATQANVAIDGQNKIVNCKGTACYEPASSRAPPWRQKYTLQDRCDQHDAQSKRDVDQKLRRGGKTWLQCSRWRVSLPGNANIIITAQNTSFLCRCLVVRR